MEENLIFRNPSHGYKFPFSKPRKIEILSAEEIQRLLIQAREDACYKLLLLELSTGLRRGKICALQWNDLNLKTGALQVERQVHRVKSELVISPPKTNAGKHTVLLPRPSVGGPILPTFNGKRVVRNVYPCIEEECEKNLAELIREMKQEIAAMKAHPKAG